MIVIVARFETDGDYVVDNKAAGLTSPPDDVHCNSGVFLCADSDEAEAALERVFKGIDAEGYIWREFVQMFAEAQCALDDPDAMRNGWLRQIGGNYEGTVLIMQEVRDERRCELKTCPRCGHIAESAESAELFRYCPQCGRLIDWGGTVRDALGEKDGA